MKRTMLLLLSTVLCLSVLAVGCEKKDKQRDEDTKIVSSNTFSEEESTLNQQNSITMYSGSMEPTIKSGATVYYDKVDPTTLQVGDIIVFYPTDPALYGNIDVQRIVEIIDDGQTELSFITKGDGHEQIDPDFALASNVLGKVTKTSASLHTVIDDISEMID